MLLSTCPCLAGGTRHSQAEVLLQQLQPSVTPLPVSDLLEVLSDIDEMSRRRPEILGFFSVSELGAQRVDSAARMSAASYWGT